MARFFYVSIEQHIVFEMELVRFDKVRFVAGKGPWIIDAIHEQSSCKVEIRPDGSAVFVGHYSPENIGKTCPMEVTITPVVGVKYVTNIGQSHCRRKSGVTTTTLYGTIDGKHIDLSSGTHFHLWNRAGGGSHGDVKGGSYPELPRFWKDAAGQTYRLLHG